MKKIISILMILSVYANAGFFSSIASTAIGTSLASKGGGTVYASDIKKRMNQVNLYLWHMHENKNYTQNYKFYLKWQENSISKSGYDDISMLDTIAWVYKDNGNKKKAIEIYETRILPWVDILFEDDKKGKNKAFRDKWTKYYKAIKK
jgi:hypothetical protein